MLIHGASNINIRGEAELNTFNLIEIIEELSVIRLTDKPRKQPAKAQRQEQLDHQNVEPAGQGGDGQLQLLGAQDG